MAAAMVGWKVEAGDVLLPVDDAAWWGASLSILMAAIHHPAHLADQQPDTNPSVVAREVLDALPELLAAGERAGPQAQLDDRISVTMVRERDCIRVSPGAEVIHLAGMLELYASAVLGLTGAAPVQRSDGYVAHGWSRDLGEATGTL